jgi:hypothetical protein
VAFDAYWYALAPTAAAAGCGSAAATRASREFYLTTYMYRLYLHVLSLYIDTV